TATGSSSCPLTSSRTTATTGVMEGSAPTPAAPRPPPPCNSGGDRVQRSVFVCTLEPDGLSGEQWAEAVVTDSNCPVPSDDPILAGIHHALARPLHGRL